MSIERLRALEKKWRDEAADRKARQISAGTDFIAGAVYGAAAQTLESLADELATLIAELGQEVGAVDPVAMRIVLPRGSTTGWEDYDAERVAGLSGNGWNVELAYSSPAHTSEARDAARLDWLASEYINLMPFDQPTGAGDADVGWRFSRFFQTRPFERVIHTHYNDNLREAIDAAMRQEGGNG